MCCAFVYVLRVSVFAAHFCNVLCCEIDEDVFLLSCVLKTCMCFLKLLCVELSGPPYTIDKVTAPKCETKKSSLDGWLHYMP